MEKLSMCRICLVENVRMYVVANENLQEIYEKLTNIPFVTEDSRPMLACFFCYAKLKQCYKLMTKCLEAEGVFAQMLNEDYERKPLINRDQLEFCSGFIKTPIEHISIVDVSQIERCVFKKELPAVCVTDDIEIKEEHQSNGLEPENLDNGYPDQEDVKPHHSVSVSADDVPLLNSQPEVEQEQEVPTKKRKAKKMKSAPVQKKTKLEIRKAKLEDTITAKQKNNVLSDPKIICTTRNPESAISESEFSESECSESSVHLESSVTKFKKPIPITIAKGYSILKKSNENIEEVINKSNTATDINCRNKEEFRWNNKDNNSDDLNRHKSLCIQEKPHPPPTLLTQRERKIRLHSGEKPFECDQCPLSFKLKQCLEVHIIREHTSEKPYKCVVCQRSFFFRHELKQHSHSVEKSYKCDACQLTFRF